VEAGLPGRRTKARNRGGRHIVIAGKGNKNQTAIAEVKEGELEYTKKKSEGEAAKKNLTPP